jgi:hypothetical protein
VSFETELALNGAEVEGRDACSLRRRLQLRRSSRRGRVRLHRRRARHWRSREAAEDGQSLSRLLGRTLPSDLGALVKSLGLQRAHIRPRANWLY